MNCSIFIRSTPKLSVALILGGLLALPSSAKAHGIMFDEAQYDPAEFSVDYRQCEAMLDNVGNHEGAGAVEQGVKRGARGAAAGAAAGAISGNSGSDAAKKGAAIGTSVGILSGRGSKNAAASQNQKERDDLMRNCMSGRGYQPLN
jgi:hypothetical protein